MAQKIDLQALLSGCADNSFSEREVEVLKRLLLAVALVVSVGVLPAYAECFWYCIYVTTGSGTYEACVLYC